MARSPRRDSRDPQDGLPSSPVPGANLWEALVSEPDTGVSIVTVDGLVLYTNPEAARLFLDSTPAKIIGKRLADLFPEPWVAERLELLRRIRDDDRPAQIRTVWRGRQLRSTIRPVKAPPGEPDRFLVITRHVIEEPPAEPGVIMVESEVINLGALGVLTPRELEVLSLMPRGQSMKEIAALLRCSPRTVETHKQSIARKLRETDRIKLARIALAAGLSLRDAHRRRVDVPPST